VLYRIDVGHPTEYRGDRFRWGAVLFVSAAHFLHDVFTACLAPLLPLIIERLGLSLVRAGSLVVYTQLPSLLNPLLGSLADRRRLRRLFVALGPGVTGTLICLMGLAPTYAALAVMLLTVGCSLAVMHVAAPVIVSQLSGNRVGRGMSLFMLGGELARTVGPLVAVQMVSSLGLEGTWRLIPVAVASSLLLWWRLGRYPEPQRTRQPVGLFAVWFEMRRVLGAIFGVLVARAFMAGALTVYLPTFIYSEGGSLWTANISLAVFEAGAALGAFTAGTVSDWIGRRRVLLAAVLLSPALMVLFLQFDGPGRLVVLATLGFMTLSTTPVLLAVTIENSGANPAAANGTFMMMNFAVRALIILAVGAMGDAVGLRQAYLWCAGLALLSVPFVLLLPSDRGRSPA
jgi:FSR family fosmidomycin resistance protein-like MFS transporter